nr:hypothetical protein [Tanacetum cinerariifolium]
WNMVVGFALNTLEIYKLPFLEQLIAAMPVPPAGQVLPPNVLNTHIAWVKASKEISGKSGTSLDRERISRVQTGKRTVSPPFTPKPKNPPTPKKDNPAKDPIAHQCGEVAIKKAKINLDSALLWHCRLEYISKKSIKKLQHDEVINLTDIKSFDKCVSSNLSQVKMDDSNIAIEEYIRLEKEKARKCRKVFNWETAKYGKIWYDEDIHDLKSVKTEFQTIVFNDNLTSNETLFCEPTNEFSVIVYNDALTSKLDFLSEPTLCPQHINEFDLKDETSLSEYHEEEQNILYFNDLFPFNIIYTDDSKSDKDNDDHEVDIKQSSGGNHQSSGSIDFEVLIVGYEHVVMNCGSAGIRYEHAVMNLLRQLET